MLANTLNLINGRGDVTLYKAEFHSAQLHPWENLIRGPVNDVTNVKRRSASWCHAPINTSHSIHAAYAAVTRSYRHPCSALVVSASTRHFPLGHIPPKINCPPGQFSRAFALPVSAKSGTVPIPQLWSLQEFVSFSKYQRDIKNIRFGVISLLLFGCPDLLYWLLYVCFTYHMLHIS